ncbi:Tricalbin-2 [Sorochytrium milnesiophthora]
MQALPSDDPAGSSQDGIVHSPFAQPSHLHIETGAADAAKPQLHAAHTSSTRYKTLSQIAIDALLNMLARLDAMAGGKIKLQERALALYTRYEPMATGYAQQASATYNTYVDGYYHFANLTIATFICGWLLNKAPLLACLILLNIVRAWQRAMQSVVREATQAAKYRIETGEIVARLGAETPNSFNNLLAGGWSSIEPQLSEIIKDSLEPILEYYKPAVIDSLKFSRFTLGARPPYIDSIHTSHEDGVTEYQLAVTMAPTALDTQVQKSNVELVIRAKGVALACSVDSIYLQGNVRLRLQWSPVSYVEVLDIWFTEKPVLDFSLRPLTKFVDIMSVPMLKSAIIGGIEYGLSTMIHPNKLHLPFGEWWSVPSQDAVNGVLRLHIHDAKGLKNSDLIGKSDPFVRIVVNDKVVAQTNVINNNLNPHWDEIKFLPLPKPQFVRMTFEVYDHEKSGLHNSLGKAEINLLELGSYGPSAVNGAGSASEDGVSEHRSFAGLAPENGAANGAPAADLPSNATTSPVTSTATAENKDEFRLDVAEREFPLLLGKGLDRTKGKVNASLRWYPLPKPGEAIQSVSGVLRIVLSQAKNIELGNKLRSPYVEILLNGEAAFKSQVKKHSNSPIWSQNVDLFVSNSQTAKLSWMVRDSQVLSVTGDPLLGRLDRSVASIISEPAVDGWYPLSSEQSRGEGRLKMTFTWMPVAVGGSDDVHEPSIGIARVKVLRVRDFKMGPSKVTPYVRVLVAGKLRSHNRDDSGGDGLYMHNNASTTSQVSALAGPGSSATSLPATNGAPAASSETGTSTPNTYNAPAHPSTGEEDGAISDSMAMYVLVRSVKEKLELEAYNRTTNLRMGKVTLSMNKYINVGEDGTLHGLSKVVDTFEFFEGDKYRGAMDVEVSFFEKFAKPFNKDVDAVSGIVKVNIHQMRHLPRNVKTFCVVETDQKNITQQKTSTRKKSNAPVYETSFEILVKELYHSILRFVVYEDANGSLSNDKIVGAVSLFTYDIFDQTKPKWYPLENGGEISLSFDFSTVNRSFHTKESMDNMGTLTLDLIGGRDFPKTDVTGKSDPYCIVMLENEQVFKTKPHKRTLNPEWNESTTIPIYDRTSSHLVIQIMDWEKMAVDEYVDMFEIPLANLPKEVDVHSEFPLMGGQGSVSVKMYFTPQRISKPPTKLLKRRLDMFSNNMRETMRKAKTTMRQRSPTRTTPSAAEFGTQSVNDPANSSIATDNLGQSSSTLGSPGTMSSNEQLQHQLRTVSSSDLLTKSSATETSPIEELYAYVQKHNGQGRGGMLIKLVEASDLKPVDKNGLSDPFVKFYIQHPDIGKKASVFKSSTKHKTLTPHWNENFFFILPQLPTTAGADVPALSLTTKVFDHNILLDNTSLGGCTVDLWSTINAKLQANEYTSDPHSSVPLLYMREDVWLTLQDVNTGKLRLKLHVLFPSDRVDFEYQAAELPSFYHPRRDSLSNLAGIFPTLNERPSRQNLSSWFADGLRHVASPPTERSTDDRRSSSTPSTPEDRRSGSIRFKSFRKIPFRKQKSDHHSDSE